MLVIILPYSYSIVSPYRNDPHTFYKESPCHDGRAIIKCIQKSDERNSSSKNEYREMYRTPHTGKNRTTD